MFLVVYIARSRGYTFKDETKGVKGESWTSGVVVKMKRVFSWRKMKINKLRLFITFCEIHASPNESLARVGLASTMGIALGFGTAS
jgi:hypothetical protein